MKPNKSRADMLGAPVHLRLTKALRDELAQLAAADRRTISDYVRLLLEEALQARLDNRVS